MFGEIFSMKNTLIGFAVIVVMSFVMNKGNIEPSKKKVGEENFKSEDLKEMFTTVNTIKTDISNMKNQLEKLVTNLTPPILNNIIPVKGKSKSNDEVEDVSDDGDDIVAKKTSTRKKEKIKKKKMKTKNTFEEKFTGYNSNYGQDFLLLDD
tara:strand:- start:1169 stop:1621 length:453 start_codon:yes stop_codon:yes gene_type:complete